MRNLMFVVALSACGPTALYQVSATDNQGIPFYIQQQYDVRTWTYEEVFLELRAVGTFKNDDTKAAAKKTGEPDKGSDDDKSIVRTVIAYARSYDVALPYYTQFIRETNNVKAWKVTGEALPSDATLPTNKGKLLLQPFDAIATIAEIMKHDGVAHMVSVDRARIQIPTTHVAYFNMNIPRGGSASGEIDLNADGTIGKGIAQKQDQLPAAVAGALGTAAAAALGDPLNTLVAHYVAPATAQAQDGLKIVRVDFSVTPIRRTYVIKVTKRVDAPTTDCTEATWDTALRAFDTNSTCRVELAIILQRGDTKASDDDKKGNAISISGSITLPGTAPTKP